MSAQEIRTHDPLYYTCRLICESTVEENILKKAHQKKLLGDIAIEGGGFTTEFFQQVNLVNLHNIMCCW